MTVTWDIDEDAALATVRVSGRLTLDDARQTLLELYAQPSYRPPMVDLWDLRTAQIEANAGEVQSFVEFMRGHRGDRGTNRTALVVSSALEFGISRMYQAHAESNLPLSIRVFTQLDEARQWLADATPEPAY